MNSFYESEGILKVVVSKGVISTYEVNELYKSSRILFTDRECGKPCSLYFNKKLIGYCNIIIIDNVFCARVEPISDWKPNIIFQKTLLEDNEILNSELILGERKVKIADVLNLTSGSVIPLETINNFNNNQPTIGKLYVCDYEVAHGKICSIDEYWALEISSVLYEKAIELPRRDSNLYEKENYKYYDFSRPECVTRTNIKCFSRIHQFFGNYINGEVQLVDQMTWVEFKNDYKNYKLIKIQKEKRQYKEKSDSYRYYLPFENDDNYLDMEEYCKSYTLNAKSNQLMEKLD